ncbi:acetyl-CoA synthetase-like protein [Sordaria brevicollis]|uniref:Acetyl-CoA synthetase-like protein n=1 Tax=Sordaria brevicollis TaxID=83679 RepID=A0AAE0PAM2_SORBR|nr:acetyl-CoA synthetase-like protein [Sordaria brevicollis]
MSPTPATPSSTMKSTKVAYSGAPPGHVPLINTFDWCFSQPFSSVNDYTPQAQVLDKIEDERPIFVDNSSDRKLTFGQIRSDALALASGLLNLGLNPNEITKLPPTPTCPQGPEIAPVVLIQLPNSLAFAPVLLGTLAAGLTATLVSPALTSDEVAWILQNSRPRVIITAKACLSAMREALKKQEPRDRAFFDSVPIYTFDAAKDHYPSVSSSPPSTSSKTQKTQDWKVLLHSSRSTVTPSTLTPSASTPARTAVILWSSGTSGRSKGVLLSHHALNFSGAHLWHDAGDYHSSAGVRQQRWLGYVPFYHVFGLCNIVLLAVMTGSTVFVMPQFSLDGMLAAIPKRKVTYLHMAPPIAVMLAKAPQVEKYAKRNPKTGKNGFSSVVAAVTGGAPLGHEVVVEVYKRCGFRVRLGYGLSETCSTSLQRGTGEKEMMEQAGETGVPHWGVEVMVADMDVPAPGLVDGKTKAAGIDQEGEILIRAPTLLSAYLPVGVFTTPKDKQPDMTVTSEALTVDGWFRTGDVGAINAHGRLRITDRLKELIKVRAYQVAPAELEAVLCSSPSVADAGVVGVYDESEATEWPRAYVVPRKTEALEDKKELEKLAHELRHLVEKKTAKYKWLMGGVVFVKQIPKSPSGKILRRVLKTGGEGTQGVEIQVYQKKKRRAAAVAKL